MRVQPAAPGDSFYASRRRGAAQSGHPERGRAHGRRGVLAEVDGREEAADDRHVARLGRHGRRLAQGRRRIRSSRYPSGRDSWAYYPVEEVDKAPQCAMQFVIAEKEELFDNITKIRVCWPISGRRVRRIWWRCRRLPTTGFTTRPGTSRTSWRWSGSTSI